MKLLLASLFSALLTSSDAFASLPTRGSLALTRFSVRPSRSLSAAADEESKGTPEQQGDKGAEEEVIPSLANSVIPPPSTSQPIRMDPLVMSLTRMDEDTANAPSMQIPIWGELILDRSLFVLVPVAGFAVIGFFLSVYVGLNVSDDWVSSVVPSTKFVVDDGCRGLCSSQDQDLEGLRTFMNRFAK
jgi:hypothetical protein